MTSCCYDNLVNLQHVRKMNLIFVLLAFKIEYKALCPFENTEYNGKKTLFGFYFSEIGVSF